MLLILQVGSGGIDCYSNESDSRKNVHTVSDFDINADYNSLTLRLRAWNYDGPIFSSSSSKVIVGYLNPNLSGSSDYPSFIHDKPNGSAENNSPWVGNATTCKILTPRDGFKQQGVKL